VTNCESRRRRQLPFSRSIVFRVVHVSATFLTIDAGRSWSCDEGLHASGLQRMLRPCRPSFLTSWPSFCGDAVHPAGTAPWSMRLQIQFLSPKVSKQEEKEMMEQKLKQSGSAAAADEVNLNLRLSRMLGVSVGAVAP
jgi:hypothetical protein